MAVCAEYAGAYPGGPGAELLRLKKSGITMKIYGTMLCKDCVAFCAALDQTGVPYISEHHGGFAESEGFSAPA